MGFGGIAKDIIFFICIFLLSIAPGCTEAENESIEPETPETPSSSSSDSNQNTDDNVLRIGAFNIQVFGQSKASDPEVMDILADIIRTYDVIAIQEIRDKSQTALPALVDEVNSDGSSYNYVVSERLGRTTSKEQYAYIYNTQTVELRGTPHTYPEPSGTDPFHRQPYIADFHSISGNFDVVLIAIHTDPDEATEEINALDDVIEYVQITYPDEEDIIIMGDFNADGSYFDEDSTSDLDEYHWVIDDSADTTSTATDHTYDRILLTESSDLSGEYGVFRYDQEYDLSSEEALEISDHYPVYAEFWHDRDEDHGVVSPYEYDQTSSTDPTQTYDFSTSTQDLEEQVTGYDVYISDLSLADEWVSVTNSGTMSVPLTGWKITDEGERHTYMFPSFTLLPGETVTLYTEEGTDSSNELYWGENSLWNNDGDTAYLYNSEGKLVDMMDG